jgi:AraC-like DNA-binding protein
VNIINLPDNLTVKDSFSVEVFDYQSSKENFRQMVSLQQNTFSFLLEGRKEVFSNKTTVSIDESSFLLMKRGNCLMTERLPNSLDNYRSILFFFSNQTLINFIQKHQINFVQGEGHESIYSFEYDDFLRTFVNGLIEINHLDADTQVKLLEVKFEELMIYLEVTRGVDFIFSLIAKQNSQFQHFMEIVETNKLNKLSVKELSFLSNMSVSTFKREFEKNFHSSPSRWFQEKRLDHSAYLLKNNSIRPSDIFEEIGYETLSNFIQAFKAKFGYTPKQYQLT